MELVFTQSCTLNWVTKIMMWAISNVHAGSILPAVRRFPNPDLTRRIWPNVRKCHFWNEPHLCTILDIFLKRLQQLHRTDWSKVIIFMSYPFRWKRQENLIANPVMLVTTVVKWQMLYSTYPHVHIISKKNRNMRMYHRTKLPWFLRT